jgi:CheY-like chemotaxis protein
MSNRRILVVDDEPLIAMLLGDWLIELGCEVVGPAHSVDDALSLLHEGQVHGAFLDVSMGTGNSYAVAEALQQRQVPMIFATGHVAESIDARFRQVRTLAKPFDFAAVQSAVESFPA